MRQVHRSPIGVIEKGRFRSQRSAAMKSPALIEKDFLATPRSRTLDGRVWLSKQARCGDRLRKARRRPGVILLGLGVCLKLGIHEFHKPMPGRILIFTTIGNSWGWIAGQPPWSLDKLERFFARNGEV